MADSRGQVQAPDMADLLEYFEERSRALDEDGLPVLDASTLQFMSLIKFNGVSILPPVLTQGRREEMMSYKHEASRREKCTRAKKKEELHAKVQSIVAGVEERRAAKQAAKSLKPTKSPSVSSRKPSSDKRSTEIITKVISKVTSQSGVKVPSEIIINVTKSSKDAGSPQSKALSKSATKASSSVPSRSASQGSSDTKKKEHTNYKSLGKIGILSKQKSFSSQHLDRTDAQANDSDTSTSSAKNLSLSPNSRALLPHPPVGRPPSRGSSIRQSSSTPDLRNIEAAVKTEDLRKPLPYRRSLSPKGGRPQAADCDNVVTENKNNNKMKGRENIKQDKSNGSKVKQDSGSKRKENNGEQIRKTESDRKLSTEVTSKKHVEYTEKDKHVLPKAKSSPPQNYSLHNPLEILEQDLTREEEHEMEKRFANVQGARGEVMQELDPIQAATAELFPFPISEEQALATLDSIHSDFASIDQFESLPSEYNGIPLTSLKQQQIIHMLTKLSKALNMEDTLTSTTSSYKSGEPVKQEYLKHQGENFNSGGDYRSVPNGATGRTYGYLGPMEIADSEDDSSVNVYNDSTATNSSFQNSSAHSRARLSPTGSSVLSAASSVSASRSRLSPKSLKNTVHFSTLVTEISTSASQSYEDKISYRKLDITPKHSENFEDSPTADETRLSKNLHSEGPLIGPTLSMPTGSNNLLSKVALSPSVDSFSGSPGEFQNHNHFETSNQESDLNTSDKENEFVPADPESSEENYSGEMHVRPGRNQSVLNVYTANIPPGPIGENHPAVVHVKSSFKSDLSGGNTLKESQDKVLQENFSKTNLNVDAQYYCGTNPSELDRYIQCKITPSDSISSMQEEITRSYLLSQSKVEFKKPKQKYDIEESPVFLKPVIFSNNGNSLQDNRSMLDKEDIIRSNLQKVQLVDSDSEEQDLTENNEDVAPVTDEIEFEQMKMVIHEDNEIPDVQLEHLVVAQQVEEIDGEEPVAIQVDFELKINSEEDDQSVLIHEDIEHPVTFQESEQITPGIGNEQFTDKSIPNMEIEGEQEAKAEHMQKYLNQVHEQSLHHEEDNNADDNASEHKGQSFPDVMDNIGALIQSFTCSIESMNHLSQEELFRMQTDQFELIQQKLLEHQRTQLEELFVAQRKEQMSLEQEIEEYHTQIKDVDSVPMPDPLLPQTSRSMPQATQAWQSHPHHPVHSSAKSPPFSVQPVASVDPYQNPHLSYQNSFNNSYSTIAPFHDPRMCMMPSMDPRAGVGLNMMNCPMGYVLDPNVSNISHNTSYSTIPHREPGMFQGNQAHPPALGVIHSQDPALSGTSNPFIYPTSPSLYTNPKDRDNASESDVSGFAKATPKQLVFSNQSTPVLPPKMYKPIQHSPVKQTTAQQQDSGRYVIPNKVFDPAMKCRFDRVSAVVKGYLTRRLLRTPKVQEIIKKLSDTRNFAFSFQAETPIKKGSFTHGDRTLLERIIAQLQAALLDIHEIFFIIPLSERLAIISSARQLEGERRLRESQRRSVDIVSCSQPRLSTATLKAMERKKKAQPMEISIVLSDLKQRHMMQLLDYYVSYLRLAEEAVFGSMEFRPKTAPPATSSPHTSTDISGPLRRHYHSLFVRALRPLQGQMSPITGEHQLTVREMKERPRTAPEKRKSTETNSKMKRTTGTKSHHKTSNTTTSNKQKTAPVSTKVKMDKAWR